MVLGFHFKQRALEQLGDKYKAIETLEGEIVATSGKPNEGAKPIGTTTTAQLPEELSK